MVNNSCYELYLISNQFVFLQNCPMDTNVEDCCCNKKLSGMYLSSRRAKRAGCYIEMALLYHQPHQHELVGG